MTAPLLLLCLLPVVAEAMLAGGIANSTVDPNSEPVSYAVSMINNYFRANGDPAVRRLAEIVNARSQVVNGEKLYLTLRLTGDPKGDDFCKVEVWYRSWIKDASGLVLTKIPECSKSPIRRPLLGRPSTRKVLGTSPAKEVADALNFAVCAVNTASNDMFLSVLGDSSGVTYTQQMTAGTTYRFYSVPLLTSSCTKTATSCPQTDLSACAVSDNARTTTCDLVVQSQPWQDPVYSLTEMKCS